MKRNSNNTWKLGMFVIIGLVLLIITIYSIGKNKNLFGSTFNFSVATTEKSGRKSPTRTFVPPISIPMRYFFEDDFFLLAIVGDSLVN